MAREAISPINVQKKPSASNTRRRNRIKSTLNAYLYLVPTILGLLIFSVGGDHCFLFY